MTEGTLEWLHSTILDLYGAVWIRNNIKLNQLAREYRSGWRDALCRKIALLQNMFNQK